MDSIRLLSQASHKVPVKAGSPLALGGREANVRVLRPRLRICHQLPIFDGVTLASSLPQAYTQGQVHQLGGLDGIGVPANDSHLEDIADEDHVDERGPGEYLEPASNGRLIRDAQCTRKIAARFLVGADGERSKVSKHLGIDRNTYLLAGPNAFTR